MSNRKCKTIPGTQSYHAYVPLDEVTIEARVFSLSDHSENLLWFAHLEMCLIMRSCLNNWKLILLLLVCTKLKKKYFAKILNWSTEDLEVKVHFMKPCGEEYTERGCRFSHKNDVAHVPITNTLSVVQSLKKLLLGQEIFMWTVKN